jgi:hypothetical protein
VGHGDRAGARPELRNEVDRIRRNDVRANFAFGLSRVGLLGIRRATYNREHDNSQSKRFHSELSTTKHDLTCIGSPVGLSVISARLTRRKFAVSTLSTGE